MKTAENWDSTTLHASTLKHYCKTQTTSNSTSTATEKRKRHPRKLRYRKTNSKTIQSKHIILTH